MRKLWVRFKTVFLVIFTVPMVLLAQQGATMIRSYTGGRYADVNAQHELLVDGSASPQPILCATPTNCNVAIWSSTGAAIEASTDPCDGVAPTTVPISQTSNTKVISSSSGKKNYICELVIVVGGAEAISIVEGTGSVCASSTAAVIGATTAASGLSFAANGGISGINRTVSGVGTTVDTCLFQDGSDRVAGVLTYVQQ